MSGSDVLDLSKLMWEIPKYCIENPENAGIGLGIIGVTAGLFFLGRRLYDAHSSRTGEGESDRGYRE